MAIRLWLCFCAMLCTKNAGYPQERNTQNAQFWFDYIPSYPMGKWVFDYEIGPRVVSGSEAGASSVSPNWEYSLSNWIDFTTGLSLAYTHQAEDLIHSKPGPMWALGPIFTPSADSKASSSSIIFVSNIARNTRLTRRKTQTPRVFAVAFKQ